LNSSKNFVANTGNTTSSYDFQIDDVSKLKIEDTQTTISTKLSVPNLLNTHNVFPTANNSYDIGSTSLRYNDVYSTNLNFATCDATGQCNIATILCSTDLITGSTCNIRFNDITRTKSLYH
jgi:hypothetical protein